MSMFFFLICVYCELLKKTNQLLLTDQNQEFNYAVL